jgi:hypothetical protein
MLIYVDTNSGTYGAAENNLVIFDATEGDLEWLMEGHSDSEIVAYALARRHSP